MKKTIIYLFSIMLAVNLFTACDDPYADQFVAEPTVSEQVTLQSADGFTITLGSGLSSAVVLTTADVDAAKAIEAVKATATPQLAEGATLKFVIEASDTKDFTKVVEIPSVSANNAATVTASDLNTAIQTLFGKAPNARELYLRITTIVVDGNTMAKLPTATVLGPVTVTPAGMVIETEYYLIGDVNGWDINNLDAYKFSHSGKDVYEDPYFTILVNNLNGYFKIVPKSSRDAASWNGVLGNPVDGNTALTGDLIVDNAQAMRVTEPGWVKVTLNMLEYTYTIEIIGEMNLTLYVPGGYQGWDPAAAPTLYCQNFDFKYDGYVYFNAASEFKFTSQADWNGTNYGDGGSGTLSTANDAGNLSVATTGFYRLNADLSGSPYTYSVVKTDWGLIGDATIG
ncbi:MAG: DUF5115 domain-containing protein [Petrimonas sp.]|nr:DUF5115 domain-containing protein [Petrimonas sp.]